MNLELRIWNSELNYDEFYRSDYRRHSGLRTIRGGIRLRRLERFLPLRERLLGYQRITAICGFNILPVFDAADIVRSL